MASNLTLAEFYASSLGQYALRWEKIQYDKLVADCFGYNAVQIGASGVDFLSNNRIALKIAAESELKPLTQLPEEDERARIQLSYQELPFESESVDLILLPHALEMAADPHALLREVSRVLIPGGRVILTGFNMTSLWGLRVRLQQFGAKKFLPGRQFISVFQLRDWLHLLSFRVDRGTFGRYGWTFQPAKQKEDSWLEKAGDRWWPQCGAMYAIGATKHVEAYKFVGRAVKKKFFVFGAAPSAGESASSQSVSRPMLASRAESAGAAGVQRAPTAQTAQVMQTMQSAQATQAAQIPQMVQKE